MRNGMSALFQLLVADQEESFAENLVPFLKGPTSHWENREQRGVSFLWSSSTYHRVFSSQPGSMVKGMLLRWTPVSPATPRQEFWPFHFMGLITSDQEETGEGSENQYQVIAEVFQQGSHSQLHPWKLGLLAKNRAEDGSKKEYRELIG